MKAKKLLSVLLVLAMVFSLLPSMGMTAEAASTDTLNITVTVSSTATLGAEVVMNEIKAGDLTQYSDNCSDLIKTDIANRQKCLYVCNYQCYGSGECPFNNPYIDAKGNKWNKAEGNYTEGKHYGKFVKVFTDNLVSKPTYFNVNGVVYSVSEGGGFLYCILDLGTLDGNGNFTGDYFKSKHTHDWKYSATANKLTAKCEGAEDCDVPNGKSDGVSLTLTASDENYSGSAVEPTITYGKDQAEKTAWTNAGLVLPGSNVTGAPTITKTYYNTDSSGSKIGTELSGAPSAVGRYIVDVKVSYGTDKEATVSLPYELIKPEYLTFTAEEANSTITFDWASGTDVKYSTDGTEWNDYTAGTAITLANVDDTVSFKGTNVTTSPQKHFVMTGKIAASGDVTSLTNGTGGDVTYTDSSCNSMFFGCTALTAAPNLPATKLADSCYALMFRGCTELTEAPALPATAMAQNCYNSMFYGCTELTEAPTLPAESLAKGCYDKMFYECKKLVTAPALPATELTESCYIQMFYGCLALTEAPELPANKLAKKCYGQMFTSCIGLTKAPALEATTLAESCYTQMFSGCTGLTEAPALCATELAKACYDRMFNGCTGLKVVETNNPSEATWIFPATSASNWNSNMIFGLTATGTLTSVAAEKMYKVTAAPKTSFDLRDGNDPTTVMPEVKIGDKNDAGYTFAGWYTDKDGCGDLLTGDPVKGTSYYAKWTKNGKTVLTQPLIVMNNKLCINDGNNVEFDASKFGITFTPPTGESAAKITLNNAAFNLPEVTYPAILAVQDVDIVLVGESTMIVTGEDKDVATSGISASANLSITSEAESKLTVDASGVSANQSYGIDVKGNLTVGENVALDVTSGTAYVNDDAIALSYGVYVSPGNLVNNGSIVATGGTSKSENAQSGGIAVLGTTENNGSIKATFVKSESQGTKSYGMVAIGLATNNGTLEATAGDAKLSYALYYGTNLIVNEDAKVTLTAEGTRTALATADNNNKPATINGELTLNGKGTVGVVTMSADGTITLTGAKDDTFVATSVKLKDKDSAEVITMGGTASADGKTFTKTAAGTNMVLSFLPTYDLRDGNGAQIPENVTGFSYTAPTWAGKDYTFAGWSENIDGTTFVSKGSDETYDATDFKMGRTYYAVWTKNSKTVLTQGIEVKTDGVYIGGSETEASVEELAKYGLAFTAAVGDKLATLTMDNAVIDVDAANFSTAVNFYDDAALFLKGDNSVILTGENTYNSFGVYAEKSLLIFCEENKEASLTVDASGTESTGECAHGIQAKTDVTIENGITVTALAGISEIACGLLAGDTTINGTLNAVGGSGTSANGLNVYDGDLTVNGTVNATGGNGSVEYYGLWSYGSVTVNKDGVMNLYACPEEGAKKAAMYQEKVNGKVTVNGTITADAEIKNDGAYTDGYTVSGATSDITKDGVTLTLAEGSEEMTITATEYTFAFNANGGTTAPEGGKTLAYIGAPADMTKEGFKFGGWYTDADFTNAFNFDADYLRTNDVTLYANWIKNDAEANYVSGAKVTTNGTDEPSAIVELFRGDEKVAATVTDASGNYNLPTVPNGEYMLVITKNPGAANEQIITKLITIGETNTGVSVDIPTQNVSSVVAITENTPNRIVVGGLDEVAAGKTPVGDGSISVTMKVENKEEADAPGAAKIKDLEEAKSKTVDFLDMSIFEQAFNADGSKNGDATPVPTTTNLIKVVVPYSMSGKKDIVVLRYHGITAAAMTENPTAGQEGFVVDETNGTITIYAQNFSTYAIAYTKVNNGGGGGGGGSATNSITLPAATKHGKVAVDKKAASSGATVTITVTPDKGYTLETLTVKDSKGSEVALTKVDDTTYTFKMPDGKVEINATFMEDKTACPQDETCVYAKFTDADTTAWYHDGVHFCVENGYMQGVSAAAFNPSGTTTRAMIVTMLWRMEGKPVANYAMSFKDVKADQWYTEAIRWAQSTKIVEGYSAEKFGPDDPITREQMATILYRYAKYHEIDVANTNTLAGFTDVNKVSAWALDAMKWANAAGLVQGRTTTTLVPEVSITRAEAATMVQRYCEDVRED